MYKKRGVFAAGLCALLLAPLCGLASGCQSSQGSTALYDPGKEEEQKKIAEQHAESMRKREAAVSSQIPAGIPTGPPAYVDNPGSAKASATGGKAP